MDFKAKYLSDTCSDPIEFLHQLRQTTEPIGGGTEYCEDGELVEYDVAVEAVKKATDAFIEKACEILARMVWEVTYEDLEGNSTEHYDKMEFIEDFRNYMKGEQT